MVSGPKEVKVDSLQAAPLDFTELADALKPLANDKRLELLHFLTRPHYLEEIASHLKMARQAAQKHVEQLLEIGVIKKQSGKRESGPVQEYVVVPQRLFALSEDFARLGVLKPQMEDEMLSRTQVATKRPSRERSAPGPTLAVVHGMHAGTVHQLYPPPGPWTIGRDADRTMRVDYDPFVSNRHAEIAEKEGRLVLRDAFSTNGTFHNWQRLERGAEVVLAPGDVVGVGKSLFVFKG